MRGAASVPDMSTPRRLHVILPEHSNGVAEPLFGRGYWPVSKRCGPF